jgi:hypothetical protein
MTRTDYKIIFTSLGFLAVILDNLPRDKQASRAPTLAQLFESFCASSAPEAFDAPNIEGAAQRGRFATVLISTHVRRAGSAKVGNSLADRVELRE